MPAIHSPLRAVTTSRTPERQRLASAIFDRKKHETDIAAIGAALATAQTTVRNAKAAVVTATAAIELAKTETADALVNSALKRPSAIQKTVKQARADLTEAQDELDAATIAETTLAARLGEARQQLPYLSVDDKVRDVVRADPATRALVERFNTHMAAALEARQALSFLGDSVAFGMLPVGTRYRGENDLTGLNGAGP